MAEMTSAALRTDLKAMLMDSAAKFTDPDDFDRFLETAARDLARVKPLVERATLTLTADTSEYPAPSGIVRVMSPYWGLYEQRTQKPWDTNWPGQLPRLTLDGTVLHLSPAPDERQITLLGETYDYSYVAPWVIGDNIPEKYRDLLLIRAAAAAMLDLANRNITKPVKLGACGGQPACNGTAAGLVIILMDLFERMAA